MATVYLRRLATLGASAIALGAALRSRTTRR